jgi:hypothetical protein
MLPRREPGHQVPTATVADGVELGGQPARDRPSACCRFAWIDASPLCGPQQRAGGRGPRWSQSGRPSPAPQHRRPGYAARPRSAPRCHRSASARTACTRSPRGRTARAGPATARRYGPGTGCR